MHGNAKGNGISPFLFANQNPNSWQFDCQTKLNKQEGCYESERTYIQSLENTL